MEIVINGGPALQSELDPPYVICVSLTDRHVGNVPHKVG